MNEREMLEMAAKAAGFELRFSPEWHDVGEPQIRVNRGRCTDWEYWNPLQDDGEALRLAVKLNIEFACFDKEQQTNAGVWTPDSKPFDCMTPYNGDKAAAVRRAITRAAAQIGKDMP